MTDFDPIVRTRTVSRVVGPYLMAVAAMLFARQHQLAALFTSYMQNDTLVLITGAFALMVGLVLVAAHHHWTGPSAVVISLIGIAAALKGAWLMIAPGLGSQMIALAIRTPDLLLVIAGIEFLVGCWLTFVGWLSRTGVASR